jgi:hypothetical protein
VIQNIGPDDIVHYIGGGGGGGGLSPQSKSTNFTAESGIHYLIDTSGGAVTVTLPTGEDGARIRFSDSDNTFATNNVTINRAGSDTINYAGLNDTQLKLDINSSWTELTWDTANSRWLVDTAFNPSATTLLMSDGSANGPAFSFLNDTNTGIYRVGADILGFATAGINAGQIGATGAWTLGPSSFIGNTAYHTMSGNGVQTANPQPTFSDNNWVVGNKNCSYFQSKTSQGVRLITGGYNDGTFRNSSINTAMTVLALDPPTADSTIVFEFRKYWNGSYTIPSADTAMATKVSLGTVTGGGAWTLGPDLATAGATRFLTIGGTSADNGGEDLVVLSSVNTGTTARNTIAGRSGGTLRWRIGSVVSANGIAGAAANDLIISASSQDTWFSGDNGVTAHGRMTTAGAWSLGSTSAGATIEHNIYGHIHIGTSAASVSPNSTGVRIIGNKKTSWILQDSGSSIFLESLSGVYSFNSGTYSRTTLNQGGVYHGQFAATTGTDVIFQWRRAPITGAADATVSFTTIGQATHDGAWTLGPGDVSSAIQIQTINGKINNVISNGSVFYRNTGNFYSSATVATTVLSYSGTPDSGTGVMITLRVTQTGGTGAPSIAEYYAQINGAGPSLAVSAGTTLQSGGSAIGTFAWSGSNLQFTRGGNADNWYVDIVVTKRNSSLSIIIA